MNDQDRQTTVFNIARINARLTEIGIDQRAFRDRTGISIYHLEQITEPAGTSIALLLQLAELLDLPLDHLLARQSPHPTNPPTLPSPHDDATTAEAALSRHGRLGLDQLAHALNWTTDRVADALNSLETRLEPGPRRLLRLGQHVEITVRAEFLTTAATRLSAWQTARTPLSPHEAAAAVTLLREELLGREHQHQPHIPTDSHIPIDRDWLINRRIAVSAPPTRHAGDLRDIAPHPDLLFALHLTDRPADDLTDTTDDQLLTPNDEPARRPLTSN